MECQRKFFDLLPTTIQRDLMLPMYCSEDFVKINFAQIYYGPFDQNIYLFLLCFFALLGAYLLLIYPLVAKIITPSFLVLKKRLKVTSIFMSGIVYPIIYNYILLTDIPEFPDQNYRYHNVSIGIILGSFFSLISIFFGFMLHFAPENMKISKYPVIISLGFLVVAILIVTFAGLFQKMSPLLIPVLLGGYLAYVFAMIWAEKKEIESIEKGKRANEALENFQKMMGGTVEEKEVEIMNEKEKIKQQRMLKNFTEKEDSLWTKVLDFVFDPNYNSFISTIYSPILFLSLCVIPFKANPFMKTNFKYAIICICLILNVEIGTSEFLHFYYRLGVMVLAIALFFVFKFFTPYKKIMSNFVDFAGICLIILLTSLVQVYLDDAVFFIGFYFSINVMVTYVLLVSMKIQIIDIMNNINLMICGEKEALLNCYTSPIFGFYVIWPYYIFRGLLEGASDFNLFAEEKDFFIDTYGLNQISADYMKILIGFFLVLLTVKMIYYIISDFKLNVYLKRTLYAIYLSFAGISYWIGTGGISNNT